MKVLLLLLLFAAPAWAQVTPATSVVVEDEGAIQGRARRVDCAGAGITCTVTGGEWTITASGGGGSGNFLDVTIAMTNGSGYYAVTVTGQGWVTGTSKILCAPFGTTADGLTVEQIAVANLTVSVSDLVAATGFNLNVFNPFGSNGTHRFHCTGA
jgi:hypothetical protein